MAVLSKVANIAVQPQPVGVVEAFAGSNAPNGWLICDGSQVSRSLFPELFSVIGTTYGSGDGFSTFTLPDLRGRTIAGRDGVNNMNNGPTNRLTSSYFGASGTALGNSGGVEAHTLTTAQLAAHNHGVSDPGHWHGGISYAGSGGGPPNNSASWTVGGASSGANSNFGLTGQNTTGISIQNNGSGNAHNNTQPTIILNYIIKAVSELPRGGWYNSSSPDLVTSLPTNPYVGQEVYHSINAKIYPKRYNGSSWDEFSINTSSLPAGSIVQIARHGWSTETVVNGSGSGWVAATNSSTTFTPQFSNSQIWIVGELALAPYYPAGNYAGMSARIKWRGNVVSVQSDGAGHEVYLSNGPSAPADLYSRTIKTAWTTASNTTAGTISTDIRAYSATTHGRINQASQWESSYTILEIKQ